MAENLKGKGQRVLVIKTYKHLSLQCRCLFSSYLTRLDGRGHFLGLYWSPIEEEFCIKYRKLPKM